MGTAVGEANGRTGRQAAGSQRSRPARPLAHIAALFGLGALVAACAQAETAPVASGTEPFTISQQTNDELQAYLKEIYPNRRGAFAVSADGRNSFYFYCPDMACSIMLFGAYASSNCESLAGDRCSLLFVNSDPRMAYTVSPAEAGDGKHGSQAAGPINEP